jgi:hypothetical protein
VTIAKRPSGGSGTAGDVLLIWVCDKAEYFFNWDWTTQITLIRLNKSAFWRKLPARRLDTHGPHFVNRGLWHCLLPDPMPVSA